MLSKSILYVSFLAMMPALNAAEGQAQHPASHELMTIMESMCQSSAKMPMTGNADQDFVAMMIPHHQAAMDMARAYLKEGKDEKIKGMVKKMIASQTKEVEELKSWQTKQTKDKK